MMGPLRFRKSSLHVIAKTNHVHLSRIVSKVSPNRSYPTISFHHPRKETITKAWVFHMFPFMKQSNHAATN